MLASEFGYGPVTVAWILIAYSHTGRVHSEAAFASMAGAAPLQASSGNTVRHRLNRHGDRRLSQAVDVIAKVRMQNDPQTKNSVETRIADGLSFREIKRVLKRYIIRKVFRQLRACPLTDPIEGSAQSEESQKSVRRHLSGGRDLR